MKDDRKREEDPRTPDKAPPSDDFWDMGSPKPRVYEKPSFEGRTIEPTDVSTSDPAPEETGVPNEAQAEKIVPREEFEQTHPAPAKSGVLIGKADGGSTGSAVNTIDGPRYVTNSYRKRSSSRHAAASKKKTEPAPSVVERSYEPSGSLIRHIDVRMWEADVTFYSWLQKDALLSHRALPAVPYTEKMDAVPFLSYIPQYAHMSGQQIEFYRWVRENIRHGQYPDCDLPYLQLYISEILNLSGEMAAEEGATLLSSLWAGYRNRLPRLDGYLCDWLPDYCMIHGIPLPAALRNLLPELVPKAQFKEFFLNLSPENEENLLLLSRCLIETLSDYDFRTSRYYAEHKDEYEAKIPAAVGFALSNAIKEKRGMFSLDRVYKMTRDSYCGAIVSSSVKRRLDIEFCSFTRQADNRAILTALVKYAENKVRTLCGVKAKLGNADLDPADVASVDRWFAPLFPQKEKKSDEDRYMPEDYLKYYEAETSGFDRNAAAAIEQESWINTSRLTGEEYGEAVPPAEEAESVPAPEEAKETAAPEETPQTADPALVEAIRAALDGSFRQYARSHGLYEGELADRVNRLFLDLIGDVALEDGGDGFALIEDYREDVEKWLSTQ